MTTASPATSSEPPLATAAQSPLAGDVPCNGCGYSLRGLRVEAACPECGAPISATMSRRPLALLPPRRVRRAATGFALVAVAWPASILVFLAMEPLAAGVAPPTRHAGVLIQVAAWLPAVAVLLGVGRATTKLGGERRIDALLRWSARGLVAAHLVLMLLFMLESLMGWLPRGLALHLPARIIDRRTPLVLEMLLCLAMVAYAARLAARCPAGSLPLALRASLPLAAAVYAVLIGVLATVPAPAMDLLYVMEVTWACLAVWLALLATRLAAILWRLMRGRTKTLGGPSPFLA